MASGAKVGQQLLISKAAYLKILLHSTKYPHLPISGVLLGRPASAGKSISAIAKEIKGLPKGGGNKASTTSTSEEETTEGEGTGKIDAGLSPNPHLTLFFKVEESKTREGTNTTFHCIQTID
jgi:hypothetical protein